MTVLFGMGVHSTFFGPLKYGILPDHLAEQELVAGNALIEAGTFLAILLGTIAGGALIGLDDGMPRIVSGPGIAVAIGGDRQPSRARRAARRAGPPRRLQHRARDAGWCARPARSRAGLAGDPRASAGSGSSAQSCSPQFPAIAKDVLAADEHAATLFLTPSRSASASARCSATGCSRARSARRYVPSAALAMSVFILDLYFAAARIGAGPGAAGGSRRLPRSARPGACWSICSLLSMAGGIFIVPLYAIMQERSERGTARA